MDRKLIIGILVGVGIVIYSIGFSFYTKHENTDKIPSSNISVNSSKYVIGGNTAKAEENKLQQSSPNSPVNKKGIVSVGNINGGNSYSTLGQSNLPNINNTKFTDKSNSQKQTVVFSETNINTFNKLYPNSKEPIISNTSQSNILIMANQKTLDLAEDYKGVIDKFISDNNSVEANTKMVKLNNTYTYIINVLSSLENSYGSTSYGTSCKNIIENLQSVKELSEKIYNTYNGSMSSITNYYANLNNSIYVIQSNLPNISSNINYNKLQEWTHSSTK